jgi:biofilm protein TabA
MIQNRIQENFNYLNIQRLHSCLDYVRQNQLNQWKAGRYDIDGDRIYMNIVEYDTRDITQCYWEAHRKYIELHVILLGSEQINLNHLSNLISYEYIENDDYIKCDGKAKAQIILNENDYLVCFPEDAHMTAIKPNKDSHVIKAIFKIQYAD